MGQISSILAGAQIGIQNGRDILGRSVENNRSGSDGRGGEMMGDHNRSVLNGQTLNGSIPLFNVSDSISGEHWIDDNSEYQVDLFGYDANGNLNFGVGEDGYTAGIGADGSLYLFQGNGALFNEYGRVEGGLTYGIQGEGETEFRLDPSDWSGGAEVDGGLFVGSEFIFGASTPSENASIDITGRRGLFTDGGMAIEIDPSNRSGSVGFNGSLFSGVELDASAAWNNRFLNAEVGIDGRFGPQASGSTELSYTNGNWDFDSDVDRIGLWNINDASASVSLNPEGFRQLGTDLYNTVHNFIDSRFPNDYYDPYMDHIIFENGWQPIEADGNGSSLDDRILFDSIDMHLNTPDHDFDPDLYYNLELQPDNFDFIDPPTEPNGFDTFEIDSGIDTDDNSNDDNNVNMGGDPSITAAYGMSYSEGSGLNRIGADSIGSLRNPDSVTVAHDLSNRFFGTPGTDNYFRLVDSDPSLDTYDNTSWEDFTARGFDSLNEFGGFDTDFDELGLYNSNRGGSPSMDMPSALGFDLDSGSSANDFYDNITNGYFE